MIEIGVFERSVFEFAVVPFTEVGGVEGDAVEVDVLDGGLRVGAVFLDDLHAFDLMGFADDFFREVHKFADGFPFGGGEIFDGADVAARDDHDLAVDVGVEWDGHDDAVFFVEDVFVAHVAEDAFADGLPDAVIITFDTGVAVVDLLLLIGHFVFSGHGNGYSLRGSFRYCMKSLRSSEREPPMAREMIAEVEILEDWRSRTRTWPPYLVTVLYSLVFL